MFTQCKDLDLATKFFCAWYRRPNVLHKQCLLVNCHVICQLYAKFSGAGGSFVYSFLHQITSILSSIPPQEQWIGTSMSAVSLIPSVVVLYFLLASNSNNHIIHHIIFLVTLIVVLYFRLVISLATSSCYSYRWTVKFTTCIESQFSEL